MNNNSNNQYILKLKNIKKYFPGVKALDGVSLDLKAGSVHAIVGENGAGKSTLIKAINGTHQIDEGEIWYKNEQIYPKNPRQMIDAGISTIHQELSPILDLSIAENIFLGNEPKDKLGFMDWRRLWRETQQLLDSYGFDYNPKEIMRNLTVSDIALIEIVKAISKKTSIVIMDEPTSSITDSETHILFSNIKKLKEQGVAIIYISHKLDEIFEICDEITILRDGQLVHYSDIKEIDKATIIRKMVGREISNQFPKEEVEKGTIALEVENFTGKRFQDINFSVKAGEIVGFAGLVGAGRTELFRAIFGIDKYSKGSIKLFGKEVKFNHPEQSINAGILMASEDRKREGLVLTSTIRENITLASLNDFLKMTFLDLKKEKSSVDEMEKKLSIKMVSSESLVSSLSGGNQQKVVLAKWILKSPKVLIMDEPTRGIDVGSKYEIYKLMISLAKLGVAIIMISSEMPEIIGMSDRIAVMSQGKLTGILSSDEASQEKIMELAVKGFEKE